MLYDPKMHVHGVYKKPFKSDEMRKTTTFQFHLKLGDNVVPNYCQIGKCTICLFMGWG